MVTLDGVLSWLVPTIAILFFLGVMYKAAKEPVDRVIGWIKSLFSWGGEKIADATTGGLTRVAGGQQIVYG